MAAMAMVATGTVPMTSKAKACPHTFCERLSTRVQS